MFFLICLYSYQVFLTSLFFTVLLEPENWQSFLKDCTTILLGPCNFHMFKMGNHTLKSDSQTLNEL